MDKPYTALEKACHVLVTTGSPTALEGEVSGVRFSWVQSATSPIDVTFTH